ncbi:BolA family protein [Gynuella sunshinyii]|uniref:Putative transcriptional regulator, BolA superfamily n=1 Tax=Gynuella sunshinyii YC6258 TaxID=1445510 RepID=A0A0C5VH29_9GAMM|nr:putative transcriptional regulator, BolA superfamily [Gynuella sunshinyii YC6258]
MQEQIKSLIEAEFENAEVSFLGEECNFTVQVVSEEFTGLTPVKRQQKVLAGVQGLIASGALHAISVKAMTPAEWQKKSTAL